MNYKLQKAMSNGTGTKYRFLVLFIFISTLAFGGSPKKPVDDRNIRPGYIPKAGFVPDAKTAIKIAEAIWIPIYGEHIYKEKPYTVRLKKGVWSVEGSLPGESKGGVAFILIQKSDGKILRVIHGK